MEGRPLGLSGGLGAGGKRYIPVQDDILHFDVAEKFTAELAEIAEKPIIPDELEKLLSYRGDRGDKKGIILCALRGEHCEF